MATSSSSYSNIPRSQSLTPTPCPLQLTSTPVRSQSVSTGNSGSIKYERRLSRKLPPAWTESLENLARTSPPTSTRSIDNFSISISPMSKTSQLPIPELEDSVTTQIGGNGDSNENQARPYVLDVDTPQQPMIDKSASSFSSGSTSAMANNHGLSKSTKMIHPTSISMTNQQTHSSSSSSSTSQSVNMGFLKSSSSSRSDILLTPQYHTSKLRDRGSIDSTNTTSSYATGFGSSRRRRRDGCGSASCETWSLFDEVKFEDSLSTKSKSTGKKSEKKPKETSKEKKERINQEKLLFDEDRLPTQKMLFEASLMEVVDDKGKKVRFGDLVRNRKTIVIFIRHWYCPLCAQYMNSILAEVSLDALEEANTDLIIIGNGSDKMLDGYRNKSFRCPFKMYTDPTLALYRALGLTRQTGDGGDNDSKGDYLVQSAMESTVQTVKRATKMPLRNPGHFTQLGGEFIFDGTLNCLFTHRMTTTRSHKPIRDICEEAGVRLEFIHYEPGLPPPPVHRHSFFGINKPHQQQVGLEGDDWQMERDQTINRIKALKAARRANPAIDLQDTRSRVVDHVKIVGQDLDEREDEVVLGFSALGIAT
ncbi:hypothetical protein I204_03635 [Kwoniella mangroviensis CBS 8886]|nr:hypothetical protein I204_03635 [Kwoniella mangroviensis CBS 8886]